MANSRTKKLYASFKEGRKELNKHIDYLIEDGKDVGTWLVRILNTPGNNDEFDGGEYLIRVKAPQKYPDAPPEFWFLTPNGVYDINKKVCISIGEYHKTDGHLPGLGMHGFTEQLWNGLICWKDLGDGISLLTTSIPEKKILAFDSRAYNEKHNPEIVKRFDELVIQKAAIRKKIAAKKAKKEKEKENKKESKSTVPVKLPCEKLDR
jgi:ubiquitin-conjugating enzyme E2 J2